MKHIGLLLHFYQPPTQDIAIVRRIDDECYTPLFRLLSKTSARVTVNINYSLTEQLASYSSPSLEYLTSAAGIEFTDSGAYHPILPLIDTDDVVRQAKLNRSGNAAILGVDYSPIGFFPPEMAWHPGIADTLLSLGYEWTITDDIPWMWKSNEVPCRTIPQMNGLKIFLRSNMWSNRISFHGDDGKVMADEILRGLNSWAGHDEDTYLIIAMDGETYGHHRKGMIHNFLCPIIERLDENPDSRLSALSEIASMFPGKECTVPSGSWSTTEADLDSGKPWPLWDDRDNPVHKPLWDLLKIVRGWVRECKSERAGILADKMLYSCPFWWASAGHFDAAQVRRGLELILETAEAVYADKGDRSMMDRVMTAACSIPVITGEDTD